MSRFSILLVILVLALVAIILSQSRKQNYSPTRSVQNEQYVE